MTPEQRAAQIEFRAEVGSVTLLGGWDLNEDDARAQIAAAIREAVAAERERCAGVAEAWLTNAVVDAKGFATPDPFAAVIAKGIRRGQ